MQPSQEGSTGGGEIREERTGTLWDTGFIYEAIAGLTHSLAMAQAISLPAQPGSASLGNRGGNSVRGTARWSQPEAASSSLRALCSTEAGRKRSSPGPLPLSRERVQLTLPLCPHPCPLPQSPPGSRGQTRGKQEHIVLYLRFSEYCTKGVKILFTLCLERF